MNRENIGPMIAFLLIASFLGLMVDTCGLNNIKTRNRTLKPDTVTRIIPHVRKLQPRQIIIHDTIKEFIPGANNAITIDTEAIIQNYLTTKIYRRSFTDSNFSAYLVDTIRTGELHPGQLNLKLTTFEKQTTITKYQYPSGFFIGAFAGKSNFGISGSWIRNKNQLQINTDLLNRTVFVTFQRKLSFKE